MRRSHDPGGDDDEKGENHRQGVSRHAEECPAAHSQHVPRHASVYGFRRQRVALARQSGGQAEDINGAGTVNVLDLIELLVEFGRVCP